MRLVLLAIALIVAGCANHSASVVDGDPFNTPAAPQTVYVWNGKECIEESLTPDERQKRKMRPLSGYLLLPYVMKDGEKQKADVWVEGVKPEVVCRMFAQGGSIQLPNGETLMIPAPTSTMTVAIENGQIPYGHGQFIGVEGLPDGTQLQLKTSVTKTGVRVGDIDLRELDNAMKAMTQVPPASSAHGRVGRASVSSGTVPAGNGEFIPTHAPDGAETVYIWDGQDCIETTRMPDQLLKTEFLTTHVVQNGQIKKLHVYAENVPPAVTKKLFNEGGTIDLPNGERMIFPAGMDPRRPATFSVGQATLEDGRKIDLNSGTVSLPLPEVVTVENGQIPMPDNGQPVTIDGVPDKTRIQQIVYKDKHGREVFDIDLAEPVITPPPDKSEWWKSQSADPSTAKAGIKFPPESSVNGRVGTVSMSYGMGQIKKP